MSPRRLAREESGVAVIEMALVLPLLLLIVFGVVEFGRAINYWIDETHLANTGARFAAVNRNPGPEATLQEWIRGEIVSKELHDGKASDAPSGPDAATVEICFPGTSTPVPGDPVRVTVSTKYTFLPFLDLGTAPLKATATMRLEARYDGSAYTATQCTT